MIRHRRHYLYVLPVALLLISFALMFGQFSGPVSAEDEVIPTQPPPTATFTPEPTDTPVPTNTPTEVPTDQPTATEPPQTVVPSPTPLPPSEIPEPITVILFGTGLAALSAAAARRKKSE